LALSTGTGNASFVLEKQALPPGVFCVDGSKLDGFITARCRKAERKQ
jgi:hypothetical protein